MPRRNRNAHIRNRPKLAQSVEETRAYLVALKRLIQQRQEAKKRACHAANSTAKSTPGPTRGGSP